METEIQELQKRIETVEKIHQFKADQEAVQKVQMEMLTTLRNLRASIVSENSSSSGGCDSNELVKLREENIKLKAMNEKQAYRINHLVKNMELLLEK